MKNLTFIFLLFGFSSLFAGNGLLIGWHANTSNWAQSELGITTNRGKTLSVSFEGTTLYNTSGPGIEATTGGYVTYCAGWDNGSGTKGWVLPMTTSGFTNLTLNVYLRSRAQLGTYGPRNFKLQYSTNETTWTDVPGANFVLTSSWQNFNASLPAACNNQATLYLKFLMSSNISINNGAIAPGALSDFADFRMYGDESPLPITDMNLSNTGLASNQPSGTTVGSFNVTDANIFDTYTYSLVSGSGDNNNGSFTIDGSALKTSSILSSGNYSIRVQASDGTYTLIENYIIIVSAYPIIAIGDPAWNYDAWITRVQFGSIDRSSGMSGSNNSLGYSDYTAVNSTDIIRGQSFNLTITAQVVTTYTENIRVYFDWNRDYDLTDDGEQFNLLTNSSVSNTVLSPALSISIPSNAALGNTLMRVVIDNGGNLALGDSDYGEVEDYTVNILAPSVSFTDGVSFTPAVIAGNSDQAFGRFRLIGNVSGAQLTGVTVKLNGARTGLSNLKLWSSTDAAFGSDTQLGSTVAADPGTGNNVTFNFSNQITTDGVYYFLTADVASDATGSVQGELVQNSNLTISSGILSGTISNAVLSPGSSPLPVELTSFNASLEDNQVILAWQTATEINNYGFNVERSSKSFNGDWETIGFVEGSGNSNSVKHYKFIDKSELQSGQYSYRLKQIDADGKYEYSDEISIDIKNIPELFSLSQNYPNPFNPSTKIVFALPEKSSVLLEIFNIQGERITAIKKGELEAGYHSINFNCSNLSSGVYFYSIIAQSTEGSKSFRKVLKMNIVK